MARWIRGKLMMGGLMNYDRRFMDGPKNQLNIYDRIESGWKEGW